MILALPLLLLLLFAGPAHAGTIAGGVFTAAPGEVNHIVVERTAGGVRLTDTGAVPTGCPADGPNAVICPAAVVVFAGDGDDTVEGRDDGLLGAGGGPGNDTLSAAAETDLDGDEGDDVLTGSPDADTLSGGPGNDVVHGGAGNDRIVNGDDGVDALDGGDGEDTLVYSRLEHGVHADLVRGLDGDALTSVEDIEGTNHDDGGPGNDVLFADGRGSADMRCGSGRDEVSADEPEVGTPRVHRDCEYFTGSGPSLHLGATGFTLHWNVSDSMRPCRLEAKVSGQPTRTLRRFNGRTLHAPRPATIRLRAALHCTGAYTGFAATTLRVVT